MKRAAARAAPTGFLSHIMMTLITKFRHTLEMIKFSHSIFALPFALAALFFASEGWPQPKTVGLIILAMVFARNTAMAFNRLVDVDLDAHNPRTASRHLPAKLLSPRFVKIFVFVNALLFMATSYLFNYLTFILSPVAIFIICFYSLTKRWTHFTQLFLGLALGISPIAAWIAVKGTVELFPLYLGGAVLFWVAGFDIIYATQDYKHDKEAGVKSLVVRLGLKRALRLSKLFHILSFSFFVTLGLVYQLGLPYMITVAIVGLFLAFEQSLVKPTDLSRINAAFFNVNGLVGILFLAGTILEVSS